MSSEVNCSGSQPSSRSTCCGRGFWVVLSNWTAPSSVSTWLSWTKGFFLKKNQFILYFLCWFNRNWGLHFGQEVNSSGGCALLFSFEVTLGDAQGSCSELEIQHGPLTCTWALESSLALIQLLVARLKSKEVVELAYSRLWSTQKTTCGTWDHF